MLERRQNSREICSDNSAIGSSLESGWRWPISMTGQVVYKRCNYPKILPTLLDQGKIRDVEPPVITQIVGVEDARKF